MNVHSLQQRFSARAISLAGIAGLHLLLYWLLLDLAPEQAVAPRLADVAKASRSMMLWHLPAPTVNQASTPPPPQKKNRPPLHLAVQPVKLPPASPPPISKAPPPPQQQIPSPVTAANASPSTQAAQNGPDASDILKHGTLTGQTRRDLARIASELRKESHFPPDFNVHAKPDKLAQGMAGAYRGNGGVTTTEIKLPDGRVMTKVSGPLGSYCVYKDSVGHTGGRDQMQNGIPTKTTTCPQ